MRHAGYLLNLCLVAGLAAAPIGRASAGSSDIAGGIIGGIIGGVIVNEAAKNRTRTTTTTTRPRVNSAARAANKETQTALNYFGFPAGTPDGVMGRRSRAAINQYQTWMGYPATGQLTEYERGFLMTSYNRALAGGAATNVAIAQNPNGPRGLLIAYRDELANPTPPPSTTTTVVVQPQAPATTATTGVENGLPTFMADTAEASLASHCNTVSLITNTNGGFTTLANMSDPLVALNEQFCLARTYAIAKGETLAAKLNGVSPQQIEAQCKSLAPTLQPYVSAVSLQPREKVLGDVAAFVLQSGMAPGQLAGTAKICLSVGYRTDDMSVVLGSALLLTASGQGAYGELLGHHLLQGFGATRRQDLAQAWYTGAHEAILQGQPAAFSPGDPNRNQLVHRAAMEAAGAPAPAPAPTQAGATGTLKLFQVDQ
jgi:peptidoglycan hydrolase-like protein with peptidoglycan-binding domain